jgi:hypothetical protein
MVGIRIALAAERQFWQALRWILAIQKNKGIASELG